MRGKEGGREGSRGERMRGKEGGREGSRGEKRERGRRRERLERNFDISLFIYTSYYFLT